MTFNEVDWVLVFEALCNEIEGEALVIAIVKQNLLV